MRVKIDPTIIKAIEHVMNDCPTRYDCKITKHQLTVWYEFWRGDFREFFIDSHSVDGRYVVFKTHKAKDIARDVAMILHCKLIDPNDIEMPV